MRTLLIAAGLMLYAIFYHPLLNALKKYRVAQAANITQVLVNLLLDFLLVPVMGMLGAAVATVLAYFCHVVIIETYFRVKLKKTMMMWKEDNVS